MFGGTSEELEILVPRKNSKAWTDGGQKVLEKWPSHGGGDARKIRFVDLPESHSAPAEAPQRAAATNPVKSFVIFPCADPKSTKWKSRAPWRYETHYPAKVRGKDWDAPEFRDNDWRRSNKPFGAGKSKELMRIADRWPRLCTSLFLRRRFNWKGGRVVKVELTLFHACGDVAFFLNGTHVLSKPGRNDDWEKIDVPVDAFAKALREGENVLAVRAANNYGMSPYFDCGLTVVAEEVK